MTDPDYTGALADSIRMAREGKLPKQAGRIEFYCERCCRHTDGGPYCPACIRDMREEYEETERWANR